MKNLKTLTLATVTGIILSNLAVAQDPVRMMESPEFVYVYEIDLVKLFPQDYKGGSHVLRNYREAKEQEIRNAKSKAERERLIEAGRRTMKLMSSQLFPKKTTIKLWGDVARFRDLRESLLGLHVEGLRDLYSSRQGKLIHVYRLNGSNRVKVGGSKPEKYDGKPRIVNSTPHPMATPGAPSYGGLGGALGL